MPATSMFCDCLRQTQNILYTIVLANARGFCAPEVPGTCGAVAPVGSGAFGAPKCRKIGLFCIAAPEGSGTSGALAPRGPGTFGAPPVQIYGSLKELLSPTIRLNTGAPSLESCESTV
jgi:hypothetical protein